MALKKSEPYSFLWASHELRGGMVASQYTDYVLVLLFLTAIAKGVQSQLERISNTLAGWIQELADRYETPVKTLSQRVVELESKVNDHLRKMGFEVELAGEAR